jgi:DNA polymerase-3 subunit alpha
MTCAPASRWSSRSAGGRQARRAAGVPAPGAGRGVAKRLEAPAAARGPDKADGEVSLVLMLAEGTEVEVKLPGRFKVSPQIAGAIKAVPGVVAVEAL